MLYIAILAWLGAGFAGCLIERHKIGPVPISNWFIGLVLGPIALILSLGDIEL